MKYLAAFTLWKFIEYYRNNDKYSYPFRRIIGAKYQLIPHHDDYQKQSLGDIDFVHENWGGFLLLFFIIWFNISMC